MTDITKISKTDADYIIGFIHLCQIAYDGKIIQLEEAFEVGELQPSGIISLTRKKDGLNGLKCFICKFGIMLCLYNEGELQHIGLG